MQKVKLDSNAITNDGDVFESRYYRINKRALAVIGGWPYQTISERTVRTVIVSLMAASLLIPQILETVQLCTGNNYNRLNESVSNLVAHLGAYFKHCNVWVYLKTLKELLERTRINWESCPEAVEQSILRQCGEKGRRFTIVYLSIAYGALLCWLLLPLLQKLVTVILPLNYTQSNYILYPTDYKIDQQKYFVPVYIHGCIVSVSSMLMILGIDTLHMVMAQHACGMFDIIRYRLENIIQEDPEILDDMFKPDLRRDICYQRIIPCIKIHKRTVEYVELMEVANEWLLLIVLVLNMLTISFAGCGVVATDTGLQDTIRYAGFLAGIIVHLYGNTLPGHWIMESSSLVRDSSYNVRWYIMSRRSRGLIIFLLRRTINPCTITAGKMFVMSMEKFSNVIKTSLSYFTVLTSVQ